MSLNVVDVAVVTCFLFVFCSARAYPQNGEILIILTDKIIGLGCCFFFFLTAVFRGDEKVGQN